MTTETQAAFARRIGVCRPYITNLKQAGRLVMDDFGLVEVESSISRIRNTSREEKQNILKNKKEKEKNEKEKIKIEKAKIAKEKRIERNRIYSRNRSLKLKAERERYYIENEKEIKELKNKLIEIRREKNNKRKRDSYKNNKIKELESRNKWRKKNISLLKELYKKYTKYNIENLTDRYVCQKIGIKLSDCPVELINFKREQIELSRLTRMLVNQISTTLKEKS